MKITTDEKIISGIYHCEDGTRVKSSISPDHLNDLLETHKPLWRNGGFVDIERWSISSEYLPKPSAAKK
jgi:hypothetical protein